MKLEFIPYNPNNSEHSTFLYKLMKECAPTLRDDRARDPILIVQEFSRRANVFLIEYNGQLSGYLGALIDVYDNAYIEAAATGKARRFFPARESLRMFCRYLFADLKVNKIFAQIPTFNKPAETVARAIGFRKEGISKNELRYNGRPTSILNLALLPEYLKDKPNGK